MLEEQSPAMTTSLRSRRDHMTGSKDRLAEYPVDWRSEEGQ